MRLRRRRQTETISVYRFWHEPFDGGFIMRFDPSLTIPALTKATIEVLEDRGDGEGICTVTFTPLTGDGD